MALGSTEMVRAHFPPLTFPPNFLRAHSLSHFLLGFENGSPDGQDPLQVARTMASRGITLVSSLELPRCSF
jgi:hypothetical protein